MLPFLKQKRESGVIMRVRSPDGISSEQSSEDSNSDEGLMMAAEDICKGVESKDYKRIAAAFRAAFEILDSQPHEEGPHLEENE